MMIRCRIMSTFLITFLVIVLSSTKILPVVQGVIPSGANTNTYHIIGVSGGLQDGFPDHNKLDYYYKDEQQSNNIYVNEAIYVGRAYIRGYKAYLDVMQDGWRQYTPEPEQPLINPNVIPTGCYEHMNEYWIYLVDSRQVLNTLLHEPRFLSITPDTGTIDIKATNASYPLVIQFLEQLLRTKNYNGDKDIQINEIGIPLVTGVWYNEKSHIPSPPISIDPEDGTEITNFPNSLAKWAGVDDADRTALYDVGCITSSSPVRPELQEQNGPSEVLCSGIKFKDAHEREMNYWDGIRKAIRTAEENRDTESRINPRTYQCQKGTVRFGISDTRNQINFPLVPSTITETFQAIGYAFDFVTTKITPIPVATDDDSTRTSKNGLSSLLTKIVQTQTTAIPSGEYTNTYHIIGVSGGLQDGFPDHNKLDYYFYKDKKLNHILVNEAIYIGRAYIRGYKAYLDVMQDGWRQYTPEPEQPLINPNVIPTGCYEHMNEYWIYLVDSRQVLNTLLYEPRFLSITPDTGTIDIKSTNASYPLVVQFFEQLLRTKNYNGDKDIQVNEIGIPLVTGVWYNEKGHIPSPPISIDPEDGTEITNFPNSLAKWAGVDDADRTALYDSGCITSSSQVRPELEEQNGPPEVLCSGYKFKNAHEREANYWDGIRKAIRTAEENRDTESRINPRTYQCQKGTVRFGISDTRNQINFPLVPSTITETFQAIGYAFDFTTTKITPIPVATDDGTCSNKNDESGGVCSSKS